MTNDIKYQIKYDHRSRYGLKIIKDGLLEITVPYLTSQLEIEKIIQKHSRWIKNHAISSKHDPIIFKIGQQIPILNTKVLIKEGPKNFFDINNGVLYSKCDDKILLLIKKYAKEFYQFKLDYHSQRMRIPYSKFRISSGRSVLGSCNRSKTINISWRTIFYPENISDYIIIHELAHILQMNHSKSFWAIVANFCPDYKKIRKYIKENSFITRF